MGKKTYPSASKAFEAVIEDLEGADDTVDVVTVAMPHCGVVTIRAGADGYTVEDPEDILADPDEVVGTEEEENDG